MKRLAFAGALVCACAATACAEPATTAVVGLAYGNFLASVLAIFASVIVGLIWALIQKYVPPFYRLFLTQDVVTNAVNAGLADIEGAVAGKVLPIGTVNAVVASAVAWANANEPKAVALIKKDLEPLIIAKLSSAGVIPPDASAATLGAGK